MSTNEFGPVRRIGISSRAMTGKVAEGWEFESALERDFMEIVRFDIKIDRYSPQPLTIQYLDVEGKRRRYTPDGLVEYRRDLPPARDMKPLLCEIKYRADLVANWRELLPKFRAARQFCRQKNWTFRIFTERDIRTDYLTNVRFLYPYLSRYDDYAIVHLLIDKIYDLRETDPEALLVNLFRDKRNRAAALPMIWYLVATHQVGCDLDKPLNMKSRIWTMEG